MKRSIVEAGVAYFGKIPSRGDFVKSASSTQLLATLDHWVLQSMELLSIDPRWKITYDAVTPMHFAFLGSRSRMAIAGHLVASCDASQRRFPFITASPFEVENPLNFIARSPLALARLWNRLEGTTRSVLAARDAGEPLREMGEMRVSVENGAGAYDANFTDFVETQTIGMVETILRQSGLDISVRRLMLALGLLLQPVMSSGASQLEKGLVLPLPPDPIYRSLVATLWLDLISRFLGRADFELVLFITARANRHTLTIGFSGALASTLQAAFDPQIGEEQNISVENADWVEGHVQADYGLKKLSSYLEQPQLSLRTARETFQEIFIG